MPPTLTCLASPGLRYDGGDTIAARCTIAAGWCVATNSRTAAASEQIDVGRNQRAGGAPADNSLLYGNGFVGAQIDGDDGSAPIEQDLGASLADLPERAGDQGWCRQSWTSLLTEQPAGELGAASCGCGQRRRARRGA